MMRPFRKTRSSGFTLMEVMVVLGISIMVMGAALLLQRDVLKFNDVLHGAFTLQEQARRAFKQMSKEVRIINHAENGSYPIAEALSDSFIFYSDYDSDGVMERMRYYVSGTTLRKGVTEPSGVPAIYDSGNEEVVTIISELANGLTDVFEYYDESYDGQSGPLTTPFDLSDIRLVKMTVIIDSNGDRSPEPQTFTTQVSLRNLKDNL